MEMAFRDCIKGRQEVRADGVSVLAHPRRGGSAVWSRHWIPGFRDTSRSAVWEPVFQSADGPQGERAGGRAEQRVEQPDPREAEAAEEGEPGAASGAAAIPPTRNRLCITHQPGRSTTSNLAYWPNRPRARAVSRSPVALMISNDRRSVTMRGSSCSRSLAAPHTASNGAGMSFSA
jgi:hypothetical protein